MTVRFIKKQSTYTLEERAKQTRDALIETPITVFDVIWDIDGQSRDNMRTAIETAERNDLPVDITQGWILADNSVRMTTAAELGQVLDAYSYRLQAIYEAYAVWRAGDQAAPFEYV